MGKLSDPITELLNTPIPEKLWHYTSIEGFRGIISSKAIFATDLRFLNDRREFIYTRNIAKDIAAATPEIGEYGFPRREFTTRAVEIAFGGKFLDLRGIQVFVAGFSREEDQLGQWRGYSHESSGVSLAFNLAELRPPPDNDTLVSFAPCVYERDHQKRLVESALSPFIQECEGRWSSVVKDTVQMIASTPPSAKSALTQEAALAASNSPEFVRTLQGATNKTRMELFKIAALLKDPAFGEEKEWRLVLPVFAAKTDLQNPRCFRAENTTLIPYIKYPLPPKSDGKLPLVDVIVGPGSDPNAVEAALSFLRTERLEIIPRESKVPYRSSW